MGDFRIKIVNAKTMKEFEKDFNEKERKIKIIEKLNSQYGIDLWQLLENNDFLLLAKCISEKRAFYYEPRKEEK